MSIKTLFFLAVATTMSVFAQSPDSVQREAIKKLDWWVGQWKGEAWSSMGPGRRDTTMMVETIRKDLDGTLIMIEGLGRRKMQHVEEGEIVHHAIAVLSYDDKKKSYRWHSWRIPGGLYQETEPTVTDRGYQWSMDTPRGKMRYAVTLDEKGQWEEVGEFSSDGQSWRQFFGMVLNRVQ
jgi:hypothetical protein